MKEKDLCSFSEMVDIIKNIAPDKIISYEGTAGTSTQTGVPTYQVIELRIAFYGKEQQENNG